MISRREIMKGAAAAALTGAIADPALGRANRSPNIIFIMADDLGFADLSCFGREDYETPNLDRLAGSGMRLTRSYANSSVCSPTRFALMTGHYQYRWPGGLDEPLGRDQKLGLPPEVATLPDLLKESGYATSLVGKWHLGGLPQFGPLKSGYGRFWGIRQGGADYFRHGMSIRGEFTHDLWNGEEQIVRQGYLTDLITQKSLEEISALSVEEAPFFLSVHYTAPHWPWEGVEDEAIARDIHDSFHYDGGSDATFASMVKSLDEGVGRIMETLWKSGLSDDTIVVFTSDNGGERFSKMWPLRGMKGDLLEGGIRVPTIVSWPGTIRANSESALINITMDFVPTLLSAAGIEVAGDRTFDGTNLLPDFLSGNEDSERTLFWRHFAQEQAAAMRGDMKYLTIGGHEYLFDIGRDQREVANIRAERPDVFASLRTELSAWNDEMLPYPDGTFSYDFRNKGLIAGH